MIADAAAPIGYLCSEFPALSHTFISREISILRRGGLAISTASINPARNTEMMGDEDRVFAASTYAIKATPAPRIARTLVAYAFRARTFFPALAYALRVGAKAAPGDPRKIIGYFVEAVLLHAWAARAGIRHVHVHFANPAATVALIATKLGGLEFSLSVHGPDEFYDVSRNLLLEKIEAAVFIRCIGYYCRSQLMRLSPMGQWGKMKIVRCGVFKDEFARRIPKEGPLRNLLCVGRVCPSKGQAILVEAASILRDRGLDFRMLLLGGGEDLEAVGNLAAERGLDGLVRVAGPVGHDRVKRELSECDLFVLPSFAEGIPIALMEAMASGVPVISTRIMGIPELIEDGVDGILTEPSNSAGLADAIERFLKGEIDARSLASRAAEKVASLYDVEANASELGELFREVRRESSC
jgi:colanic acid/amylovoran biosynthesis glycosyltransferase